MRSLGSALLIAFVLLGLVVSGPVPEVDRFVADTAGDGLGLRGVASVVTVVLGPILPAVVVVGLLVAAALVRPRAGLLLRAALLLAACRAVSLVKPVFERARPTTDYPDFSFPSGHVVSVASVGFTAVVLCAWLARERVRMAVLVSVAAVVLAALCRVILDVHWLTDLVGATLGVLGVGLLTAVALRLLPAPKPTA
ncbi:phosphatase PAP2 family protein [Actinokineospora xionganensis]|uniref:Phosphatase PAP2 family protein n=1 Tax=Actinokineospora xionganensis TaxID=2684470 RepID=A0ABR7LDQ9_9PSEU|nr:phosphatase PAP2 family protein [Actinokineospora xionganensis]MBC6450850.1 phosphatase PAP2 family protein [Actinokineospora xionganensis]